MPRRVSIQTERFKSGKQPSQAEIAQVTTSNQRVPSGERRAFGGWFRSLIPTIRFVSVWLCVLYGLALVGLILAKTFDGLVYPNVYVGPYNLGGYRPSDAQAFLYDRFSELQTRGVEVAADERSIWVQANVSGVADPDLSYELYSLDPEATVDTLLQVGRSGSFVSRGIHIVIQYFHPRQINPVMRVNHGQLVRVLKDNFQSLETPATVPGIILSQKQSQTSPEIVITNTRPLAGETFDYEHIAFQVEANVRALSRERVVARLIPNVPEFSEEELKTELPAIRSRLQAIFGAEEFRFATTTSSTSTHITLSHRELASMITFERLDKPGGQFLGFGMNDHFDRFYDTLVSVFGRPIQEAKFVVTGGRVSEFREARDGVDLPKQPIRQQIVDALNSVASDPLIHVETSVLQASNSVSDINNLGIREIIGVGKSSFKGSPVNRRHNIKVGAASVNGTLIAPGQEFSLLKTLGDITSATGYLPELVIKGDRTIPEYGGGLCQIGTTTFRGALDSGLPITARKNHSYRVSYYEPAGTDATIYDPSPDFRFVNDTGSHILIQTRIEGDDVMFEFWGTKDGRTVHQTKPRIYNIVSPPETKYIETTDLKPGEERCTERAHAGADAEFTYTVTYPGGNTKEEVFKSHYRPWQAVCLKGVVSLGTTTPEVL